jgi:hypothetical protein
MDLKLLISDNFTICTTDSIVVVRQKLMEHVENLKMIRSLEERSFRGIVSEYTFEIYPVYQSGFHAPIIIGKFESIQNETLIHLQIALRPHQYFLLGVTSFSLLAAFKTVIESFFPYHSVSSSWQILYFINMLVYTSLIGIHTRSYLVESSFAKAKLRQIFLSRL